MYRYQDLEVGYVTTILYMGTWIVIEQMMEP